jgi:prepilin-type N-terminal cleavage/methylation domain-containing protein
MSYCASNIHQPPRASVRSCDKAVGIVVGQRPGQVPINAAARRLMNARGFTLLEVILALAILAGSLAALGSVARISFENAERAAIEAEAELVASTVFEQLESGQISLTAVEDAAWSDAASPFTWTYSVAIADTAFSELLNVSVRAQTLLPEETRPIGVNLSRWVINPDYLAAQAESSEEEESTDESSGSSSSSSTTGSGTGGGTGGGGGGGNTQGGR